MSYSVIARLQVNEVFFQVKGWFYFYFMLTYPFYRGKKTTTNQNCSSISITLWAVRNATALKGFFSSLWEWSFCLWLSSVLLVTSGRFYRLGSCGLTDLSSLICEDVFFFLLGIFRVFGVVDVHTFKGSVKVKGLWEWHFLQVCHQSSSWLTHELPTCNKALLSPNQYTHTQSYSEIST